MPKITKQSNGVWSCKVQVGGKRHYLKSKDRDKVKRLLGEILAGKATPAPTGVIFDEVALEFLRAKKATASSGSWRHYSHHVTKQGGMLEAFAGRIYAQITPADYQRFIEVRRTTPSRRGKSSGMLSAQTVEHERAILVQIARFAEDRGLVSRAPITSRTLKRLKVPEAQPRMLTDGELAAILECAGELRPLLVILLHTGLRLSEARRMEWTWIDIDARTLTVFGAGSKSKHTDSVPLDQTTIDVLQALPCKTGRVVEGNWGPILDGDSAAAIYARLRTIARRAGVPRFGLHALRHAMALNTLRASGNRYFTERMLRHRDPRQMDRYARLVPDEMREQLEQAEDRMRQITEHRTLAGKRARR